MPTLKELLRAAQQDLPITVRHEKWLKKNANVKYPPAVVARASELLVTGDRNRLKSFSASSTGSCQREQIFGYLGLERSRPDGGLANIFHTGNFIHLKWQMAGLTEGWLKDIEIPLHSEEHNLKGTMDGILWDDSGFEFKSINSYGFQQVMLHGPKPYHELQVHAYMLLTEIDRFSILYENKDNGEWKEFRVVRDEGKINAILDDLESLNHALDNSVLPVVLPECSRKMGAYLRCPFKNICLQTKSWPESVE